MFPKLGLQPWQLVVGTPYNFVGFYHLLGLTHFLAGRLRHEQRGVVLQFRGVVDLLREVTGAELLPEINL